MILPVPFSFPYRSSPRISSLRGPFLTFSRTKARRFWKKMGPPPPEAPPAGKQAGNCRNLQGRLPCPALAVRRSRSGPPFPPSKEFRLRDDRMKHGYEGMLVEQNLKMMPRQKENYFSARFTGGTRGDGSRENGREGKCLSWAEGRAAPGKKRGQLPFLPTSARRTPPR